MGKYCDKDTSLCTKEIETSMMTGTDVPRIVITNDNDDHIISCDLKMKPTNTLLKRRSKSAEVKRSSEKADSNKSQSSERPFSASDAMRGTRGHNRRNTFDTSDMRILSNSSTGSCDTLNSCTCVDAESDSVQDGLNGALLSPFYKVWDRRRSDIDILMRAKPERPSSMKRRDDHRECGCHTRHYMEKQRKTNRQKCRCGQNK